MSITRYFDRVWDTTTGTGTGNLVLDNSPPTGYRPFSEAYNADTSLLFPYCIDNGAEREIGLGYMSDSVTLVRDAVLYSTNSNVNVDFSAGTKNVTIVQPASLMPIQGASLFYPAGKHAYSFDLPDPRAKTGMTIMASMTGYILSYPGNFEILDEVELTNIRAYASVPTDGYVRLRLVSDGPMYHYYSVAYTAWVTQFISTIS